MDQFVIIIEDEEKIQEHLFRALKKINPALKIRIFSKLELFSQWLTHFVKNGVSTLEAGGERWKDDKDLESISPEKRINLLVVNDDLLAGQSITLISKTVELFLRKKACSEEDKTSVIFTAFDSSNLDLKTMEHKFVNNVIFKPFDSLILEEHLRYAVIGRRKPSEENFKSNKLEAQVEMVKDINVVGFSEMGFLSVNDRQLSVGSLSKFYADEFQIGNIKSAMARCVKSEINPDNKKSYLCWMEYFALESEQIKKFRKDFTFSEFPQNFSLNPDKTLNINIIYFDSYEDHELASSIKRQLTMVQVFHYTSWEKLDFDLRPETSDLLVEKDLPGDGTMTLYTDPSGKYLIECSLIPENELIFGERFQTLKIKEFSSLLESESKKLFLDHFRGVKIISGNEPVIIVENRKKYIVKVMSIQKKLTPNNIPSIEIKLSVLNNIEKIKFVRSLSSLPKKIDLVIGSESFFKLCQKNNDFRRERKILISKKNLSDSEEREWSERVQDIFYIPFDRSYFARKIFLMMTDKLKWTKDHFVPHKKDIQSARQVQINEISEAGLHFNYNRALDIGSFRRFYLWTPNETELLEYRANCNFVEEIRESSGSFFSHHFVFFGMKDIFLKNIRLWVRENYIQSKSKNQAV